MRTVTAVFLLSLIFVATSQAEEGHECQPLSMNDSACLKSYLVDTQWKSLEKDQPGSLDADSLECLVYGPWGICLVDSKDKKNHYIITIANAEPGRRGSGVLRIPKLDRIKGFESKGRPSIEGFVKDSLPELNKQALAALSQVNASGADILDAAIEVQPIRCLTQPGGGETSSGICLAFGNGVGAGDSVWGIKVNESGEPTIVLLDAGLSEPIAVSDAFAGAF